MLRVYNWEDYISAPSEGEDDSVDLIAEFEKDYEARTGRPIRVEYSTFGTNENMYNELKINPGAYDLVCPSDYMIMKMIDEGMAEPFSEAFLSESNYAKYGSPYIRDLFEANGWAQYAVPYMWGTMGFVYNPELSETVEQDLSGWAKPLMFGLIAMLIVSVFGIFFGGVNILLCCVGIVIFACYTAYDTQKIKAAYFAYAGNPELAKKASVFSALELYLDFINLFLYILRIFSRSRD